VFEDEGCAVSRKGLGTGSENLSSVMELEHNLKRLFTSGLREVSE
jgi:hypothetical protein